MKIRYVVLLIVGMFLWVLPAHSEGLPKPLSDSDVKRYRQIFQLQEKREWKAADLLIKELRDPLLLGYVYYERYMHNNYISSYAELSAWLGKYRRLSKDYERDTISSEGFIYLASIRTLLKRLDD